MIKILVNDGISPNAVTKLTQAGFQVLETKVAQNQLVDYINKEEIQALLVRSATKVTSQIIENCPSLKLIGRGGVGLDNIDLQSAEKKGVKVINTPESSSHSVAELVFAHLFGGVRFLHESNRNMPLEGDTHFKDLKEAYSNGGELRGKTLGIIGFGRIGKAVAKIAIGLGMKVLAYDTSVEKTTLSLDFFDGQTLSFEIEISPLEVVLKNSDFITLHTPAQQKPILSDDTFALLKTGVGIINVARGGVIDETTLLHHLESGKVAFAGLDVYQNEPTPSMAILMHPCVSHTPHIGASTIEAQDRIGEELASQIISFFNA